MIRKSTITTPVGIHNSKQTQNNIYFKREPAKLDE